MYRRTLADAARTAQRELGDHTERLENFAREVVQVEEYLRERPEEREEVLARVAAKGTELLERGLAPEAVSR